MLVQAHYSRNPELDSLLKATCGILMFGTPHRGMFMESLIALTEKQNPHRVELLKELEEAASALKPSLDRFVELCCNDFKIYSFYEVNQTRDIQQVFH